MRQPRQELGITKQAVSQMFQRHPDLHAWISRQFDAGAGHYVGAVLHRHAFLGIQGSVASAELYLKAVGAPGLGPPNGENGDRCSNPANPVTNINILVSRPDMPNGGTMPKAPMTLIQQPVCVLPAPPIPVVAVRS